MTLHSLRLNMLWCFISPWCHPNFQILSYNFEGMTYYNVNFVPCIINVYIYVISVTKPMANHQKLNNSIYISIDFKVVWTAKMSSTDLLQNHLSVEILIWLKPESEKLQFFRSRFSKLIYDPEVLLFKIRLAAIIQNGCFTVNQKIKLVWVQGF